MTRGALVTKMLYSRRGEDCSLAHPLVSGEGWEIEEFQSTAEVLQLYQYVPWEAEEEKFEKEAIVSDCIKKHLGRLCILSSSCCVGG